MTSIKTQFRSMNAYDLHKKLINEYVLNRPGATKLLKRDTSRDKRDINVIEENHRFLWSDETPKTWEEQLAKRYYDKLFKEYCICDLSRYKENMVALRWRIEQEVVLGKGQFSCGNKMCDNKNFDDLKTWEVNFAYKEHGEKKNALVKLRLCSICSKKLNYHSQKREIKRLKTSKRRLTQPTTSHTPEKSTDSAEVTSSEPHEQPVEATNQNLDDETIWSQPREHDVEKSRDEEFEEYLEELFF